MRIEQATLQSADEVLALLHGQYGEHSIDIGQRELATAVRVLLTEPARGAVLLAYDPAPFGLAVLAYTWTLEHGGLVAWLDELFVIPERRGGGAGLALLKRAFYFATNAGCRAVELEVDIEHTRAEHLYAREGFRRLSRNRWAKQIGASSQTV